MSRVYTANAALLESSNQTAYDGTSIRSDNDDGTDENIQAPMTVIQAPPIVEVTRASQMLYSVHDKRPGAPFLGGGLRGLNLPQNLVQECQKCG